MSEKEIQFQKSLGEKPELPTDEARKLQEMAQEKWQEHLYCKRKPRISARLFHYFIP